MPDPIDTAGDYSFSSNFLSMFLGADFRAAMKSIISLGVGDALRMHVGDTPFGPTALWDTQNVGRNMFEHFMQQTTGAMLTDSARVREQARFDFNQRFAGMLGIDPANINPLGMTLTSFFGTELFRRMGTQQLERGLGMASRYMGALPIGFVGEENQEQQRRLQDQLTSFNRTVMQDFVRNFDQYGGLSGAGVGRIMAEGARLGMLDPADPNAAINFAQRTAQMVGTAQQFFQGSATEVMDQLNATLGVNAVATLGGAQGYAPGYSGTTQLNNLLTDMSAAGMVTGLTDQQMRMLTTGAANVAMARGGSPLGALANARDVALLATAANRSGVSAFVNEATLRQSIMNQVVRTQESESARALYGAAALVESRGGNVNEFMAQVNQQGANLSLSGVVDLANQFMRGQDPNAAPVSTSDLINAGYTQAAERMRAGGEGTMAMVESRLNSIQADRARYLNQLGINVGRLDNNFSIENIERTLGPSALTGQIRQVFAAQAERYGYRSAEEMDAALRATRLTAQMREAMGDVSQFQLEMQGFGRVQGAMGFIGLVQRLGEGGAGRMNMARLAEALIGGGGENIRQRILDREGLFREDRLRAIAESGDPNQLLGLDVAVQALKTGQIGGQRLSAEEMEDLRETFLTEDAGVRKERLTKYAGMADPNRRLALAADRATTELMRRRGFVLGEGEQGPQLSQQELAKQRRELADEGKLIAQLEEYSRLSKEDVDVTGAGKKRAEYGERAAEFARIVEETGDVKEAREMFKARYKREGREADFEAFMSNLDYNANVQTSMGASAETAPMARIVYLIQQIFNKLTGEGVKVDTSKAEQPAKKERD
jgi:hypothetical protein